ncbi:MAG: C-terminal target protein [Bacteroidetes bacterium]|nr:C-terminal target protein [Bacteroidota bacterium]
MIFSLLHSFKRNCTSFALALMLLASVSANSQTWTAVASGGGATGDRCNATCMDAAGNVYITGTINSGTATFGGTTLTSAGVFDGLVVKYNSSGALQWAIRLGGAGNDHGLGIVTDGASVYVTGTFVTSMTVGSSPTAYASAGGQDGYVLKLDAASGATTWVATMGGSSTDSPQAICMDLSGNVYVTGSFFSVPATFGGSSVTPTGGTSSDLFVTKINPAGTFLWANSGGGAGADNGVGSGICYVPALNEVVLTGGATGGGTLNYGGVSFPASVGAGNDIVLLEVDAATGTFISGATAGGGGSSNEDGLAACYDAATGDVFFCGYFNSPSLTIGSTTLNNSTGAGGVDDMFYSRYNPSTNTFTWAKSAGGSGIGSDRAKGICSNSSGGIIIGGVVAAGTCTFPSASSVQVTNVRPNGGDPLLLNVNAANGLAVWARIGAADPATATDNPINAVTANSSGDIWGAGLATTNLTFSPLPALTTNANSTDPFVVKMVAPPLTATQSQVNLTCNGVCTGSGTVVASGGTAPYTYSWSPAGGSGATASSLCATNYTVTITDAVSTSITKTFTITQPPAIIINTVSQTNVSCFGGSNGAAQVSATGGTGTLSYNWTPGNPSGDGTGSVTGLSAQVYTVTVTDANSCTATRTFNITQPPTLATTGALTNVACFGGSNGAATVSVSGGVPSYSYNWTPGNPTGDGTATVTGLTAQVYTVTVTDANSCQITRTYNITQPSAPVSGTTVVTNVSCFGGSNGTINLTPNGGSGGYTFNWLPSGPTTEDRTGLVAGTYTVQITDMNGCTGTVNATVTQPPTPVSGTTVVTNVSCFGGSNGSINLTPNGGSSPYTFNWLPSGPTTEDRTGLVAGTYTVQITDVNGCTSTVNTTVTQPTSPVSGTTVVTNVSCFGGSNGAVNLTPNGGSGGYTFNWLPSGPTTEDRTGLTAGTFSVQITDVNGCTGTVTMTVTQPPTPVSGTTVVTNVSCFGGSNGAVNLTPSGGTPGYTFNWLPSGPTTEDRTGLTAGTFSVQITDANGCTGTVTMTVTQPPTPVSGTTVVTNVSCFGGSNGAINLTPSGGTGPYTFNWLPSGPTTEDRTGLTAGTYTVQITDVNGCTGTVNTTVTQPTSPVSGTTVVTNVSCFGGSNGAINLTPSGGTGSGYTFNWLPSGPTTEDRTGLVAGTYTVVVTDANGCTGTVNTTVTQPTSPVSGTTVVTNVSCFGGSNGAINLTPSGGSGGYTFNWLPSGPTTEDRTGLVAGTYTVQITDVNGCTGTVNTTVTQPASPVSGTTVTTNVSCFGGSNGAINLTPNGGTSPYTFNWLPSGPTTEDRTGLVAGTYTVQITDVNGCTGTVNTTVTQPTSPVSGTTVVTNVSCFGGSNGAINLTPSGGTGSGYTFNWLPSGPTTEDRTGLVAGTYTVQITDANGCTGTVNTTVTQPTSPVSGTTVVTNVSCFGGSNGAINLTPNGGTGSGYTFNWLPSGPTTEDRTGLVAGTYTVQITDANGCTGTVNTTVTQPTSPVSGTTVVTNVSCFGGSNGTINLTPSGGTPGYTFNWGSGITTEDRTGLTAGTYTVIITDANGCTGTVNATVTQPPSPVSGTTVVTSVSCFGGSNGTINLTPSGGTPGYTFNWGSGVTTEDRTGLAAGTYAVIITDANGCTGTVNATVTQPPALTATISSTTTACSSNTGTATVVVSGGTPAYTYLWAPAGGTASTATGLGIGSYTATITDANGCSITKTVNVTAASSPSLTAASQTNVSCFGGSDGAAAVNPATGGTGPYSYNWTPGNPAGDGTAAANGLTAGTWTVTVTDANGCSATAIFNVTQPPAITATVAQTNATCNGACNGSATVTPAGGTPGYTYMWAPAGGTAATATGLCAGTYTVIITDANGCMFTQTVTITEPPALTAGSTATSILCNGGTAVVTVTAAGGTGPYTGEGNFTVSAGTYTYTVTDANGCTATTTITVTEPTALMAMSSATTILCNGGTADVTVSAMDGTGPYTGTGTFTVSAGTYTYTVTDANGCTATTTITVTEPTALMSMSSATTILCNGGTADVTVSAMDGTGPYTGTGTFTVSAGTYTYTVTDANGCTATTTITVSEPTALMAMSSATTILCNGGTADVTVSAMDGTGPYTGTGTFTVSAGTYTYTVTDANGCTTTTTITVSEPSAIASTTATTSSNCGSATGSATVMASGGTGTLTYLWSGGGTAATETGLTAGSYTVTITDANGCTATDIASVSDIGAPVVTTVSVDASCNGASDGSIDNTVTGGMGTYTYVWSNSAVTEDISGITAGTYTYSVTDGAGCEATGSVTIAEPAAIDVTTTLSSGTITANNATATSYQWIDCATNTAITGETGQSYTAMADGSYAVVISEGACSDTSACVAITGTGVEKLSNVQQLSIYPNPNNGVFTIKATVKGSYRIVNELGQNVYMVELNAENNYSMSIDGLSNGVYFITGYNNKQVVQQKIVVTH